ncbi:MAG: isoaspartyl peptidase/L-asparaginase [Pseudanabaenaceae cyanobacterium bins.68]|nr:isoaspartyl peptidase/L-asparaginase [Pseudanabaenaceae cyanobacterium bins.68]
MKPKLIIHGGAGDRVDSKGQVAEVQASLHQIVAEVYALLREGASAVETVTIGCKLLEDQPRFNAGTGSVLQSDGQIRMSASLMDGSSQTFSGVINVSRVQNPIELAKFLQTERDRVLSDLGAAELARELGLPVYQPLTEQRLQEWLEDRQAGSSRKMAAVTRGTIGVVALDRQGQLCAGTSTGGRGFERVGRVSDSATPAGNYANHAAAVSCTGVGEDILNETLASKIVVRVTDGMDLNTAIAKSMAEGKQRVRDFGAIAIDAQGQIGWGKTCPVLFAAYHDGDQLGDTLGLS